MNLNDPFQNASKVFSVPVVTSYHKVCRSAHRHRTKYFEVHLTLATLNKLHQNLSYSTIIFAHLVIYQAGNCYMQRRRCAESSCRSNMDHTLLHKAAIFFKRVTGQLRYLELGYAEFRRNLAYFRKVYLYKKCFLESNHGCGDSFYKSELPEVQINLHFG